MKNSDKGNNIIHITTFFCLFAVHCFAACLYIHKMLTGKASIYALFALIALVIAVLLIMIFVIKKYDNQSEKTEPAPFWPFVFVSGLWGFLNHIMYDIADIISKTATDKYLAVWHLIILFTVHFIIVVAIIKIIDILFKKYINNKSNE